MSTSWIFLKSFSIFSRCKVGQRCQIAVLTSGKGTQDLLFEVDAEVDFIAGEKECYEDIRVYAIGGGGGPSQVCCDGAGGGGSGYVNRTNLRVWSNNVDPWVVVVGGGGDSEVDGGSSRVEMGGLVLHEAEGGHAGSHSYGGDGYSGGGAGGSRGNGGPGGMDGGDGGASDYHTRGGRGSGLDLGMMVMGRFNLAPGRGGNVAGGGGGGGVLVNGGRPDPGLGAGQGYGGGGSHSDDYKKGGSTGCVLLELM